MSPEEIKAAINGAEARRHQAWQSSNAKAAAALTVEVDALWEAWRWARCPHYTASAHRQSRPKLPAYKTVAQRSEERRAKWPGPVTSARIATVPRSTRLSWRGPRSGT